MTILNNLNNSSILSNYSNNLVGGHIPTPSLKEKIIKILENIEPYINKINSNTEKTFQYIDDSKNVLAGIKPTGYVLLYAPRIVLVIFLILLIINQFVYKFIDDAGKTWLYDSTQVLFLILLFINMIFTYNSYTNDDKQLTRIDLPLGFMIMFSKSINYIYSLLYFFIIFSLIHSIINVKHFNFDKKNWLSWIFLLIIILLIFIYFFINIFYNLYKYLKSNTDTQNTDENNVIENNNIVANNILSTGLIYIVWIVIFKHLINITDYIGLFWAKIFGIIEKNENETFEWYDWILNIIITTILLGLFIVLTLLHVLPYPPFSSMLKITNTTIGDFINKIINILLNKS